MELADINQIELGELVVSQNCLDEYLSAVDGRLPIHDDGKHVPPMAIAAWVLGKILVKLALPPGSVHGVQEIEVSQGIMVGQQLSAKAKVSRPLSRKGWKFITTEFVVETMNQEEVLKGKTMVMVPENA